MMQKSTTFTTILRVKKYYFHYDMQKKLFSRLATKICLPVASRLTKKLVNLQ
jgi:hypothetical protein